MRKILATTMAFAAFVLALCGGCGTPGGMTSDTASDTTNSTTSESESEDMAKKYPYYIEEEKAKYKFDFDEQITPYFLGNVIYNETVLLVDDGKTISGKLQYKPIKILSVRDYTWKNEFASDKYAVNGNVISITKDSGLPYLTADNVSGKQLPDGYRMVAGMNDFTNILTDCMQMGPVVYTESPLFYSNQIQVSYVYDVKDLVEEDFAAYATSGMPKLKAKLAAGEKIKIAVTGDSVAEGCSSSEYFKHEPFFPSWVNLLKPALESKYSSEITVVNKAVGGKTAGWGCENKQIKALAAETTDLLIVHFGINDLGANESADTYKYYMETIVMKMQSLSPDTEILIIDALSAAPNVYSYDKFDSYCAAMEELKTSFDDVYTLNMFPINKTMLKVKKYEDITANGINHVNDFSTRLYIMNIMSALVEYR